MSNKATPKPYFILIATLKATGKTELLFGDPDKRVAMDEKTDARDSGSYDGYRGFRVIELPNDGQGTIDAYIDRQNGEKPA